MTEPRSLPVTVTGGDKLACITVTYHPDMDILQRQLEALPDSALKILVDNASGEATQEALGELVGCVPRAVFLPQQENLGLPAAINLAVRDLAARGSNHTHLLLLDQDSEPQPGSVERLLAALTALELNGRRPGAVGPQLQDATTGLYHGFHQMTRWRWRRVQPNTNVHTPVPVANLNGSGTLMRRALFEQLGGLDEALFIDHVDTEWSFRLRAAGYSLWGIPDAVFIHRMGERGLRFWWLRWRVWPARSALRHRYLFRNALWLMRKPYVPQVWKRWAAVKLTLTVVVHAVFDPARRTQLVAIMQGVHEGLRPCPDSRQ